MEREREGEREREREREGERERGIERERERERYAHVCGMRCMQKQFLVVPVLLEDQVLSLSLTSSSPAGITGKYSGLLLRT